MQIIYQLHISYDSSCAVNPKVMFENKHLRLFSWSLMTQTSKKSNSYEPQLSFIQRRATILPTQILSSHWSIYQPSIECLPTTIDHLDLHSSIHCLPSTVYHQTSTIKCLPSTVHPLPSIAYRQLFIINSPSSTVYHPPSTIHRLPYTV